MMAAFREISVDFWEFIHTTKALLFIISGIITRQSG